MGFEIRAPDGECRAEADDMGGAQLAAATVLEEEKWEHVVLVELAGKPQASERTLGTYTLRPGGQVCFYGYR